MCVYIYLLLFSFYYYFQLVTGVNFRKNLREGGLQPTQGPLRGSTSLR